MLVAVFVREDQFLLSEGTAFLPGAIALHHRKHVAVCNGKELFQKLPRSNEIAKRLVSVDLMSVVMWMLANDAQGRYIESLDKASEARG